MSQYFEKIAIIGIGLIGASMALAVRRAGLAGQVASYDKDPAARQQARALQLPVEMCESLAHAVADADLVVLAVPVGAMASVATEIAPYLAPNAVVTDTGSTKRSVVKDVRPLLPDAAVFIPGHPLAGTEFSGPAAGFPDLFTQRYWLLIDDGDAPADAKAKLEGFCTAMGAMVEWMDSDYHDRVLAITSHLPHLIAYTIVGTAVDLESDLKHDVIRFSASGFRDFTRIAASDPTMWRDVFMANDEAVLEMLQRFSEDLSYLQRAIRWKEADKLFELFTRTRAIRRSIISEGQE